MRRLARLLVVTLALAGLVSPAGPAIADPGDTFDPPDGAARSEFVEYTDGWSVSVFDTVGNLVSYVEERNVPVQAATHTSDEQCGIPEGDYGYLFSPSRRWGGTSTYRFNSGIPDSWVTAINQGKNEWQNTTNQCGTPDIIGFAASQGTDTTATYDCSTADSTNAISRTELGTNGILAQACVYPSSTAGRIAEADIRFNTSYTWSTTGDASSYDVRSVAAHEWGHYLGMAHSASSCSSTYNWTVMFPCTRIGDTVNRTLSVGDIEGAARLYGYADPFYTGTVMNLDLINPASGQKLAAGFQYNANFDVRNDGPLPWRVGGGRVRLGTASPQNRSSDFQGSNWISATRASYVDSNLTVSGKGFIAPGETGRFSFNFRVPFSKRGTVTNEYFQPVAESVNWFGTANRYVMDVGTYAGAVVDKAVLPPVLVRGLSYPVYVVIRNDGTAPWFVNDGMLLGTSSPRNRTSSFCSSDWPSCTRASRIDQNDSNLTSSYVAPGQRARYTFTLTVPLTYPIDPLNPVTENFEAVVDSSFGGSLWYCCLTGWGFRVADG